MMGVGAGALGEDAPTFGMPGKKEVGGRIGCESEEQLQHM